MVSTEHPPSRSSERRRLIQPLVADLLKQVLNGQPIAEQTILDQHPELLPELAVELKKAQQIGGALRFVGEVNVTDAFHRLEAEWSEAASHADDSEVASHIPARIGRYRIERQIGEGGFGRVYLAWDDELDRPVAIKTPHRHRLSDLESVIRYLSEARVLAKLDHPAIVPIYDAGRTADGGWYVVSKWIQGSDLASRLRRKRMFAEEAVRLTIEVARALQYAHSHEIVHRDVKPANILLDERDQPCLADFGLAAKDHELLDAGQWVGTPAYMSPEQARGEAHRVDRRSDIFSLGVVFYEALTGHKPFQAGTREALLEQIISLDPRPMREWDATISLDLERICLKMLAKRAADRYASAQDLIVDLRQSRLGESSDLSDRTISLGSGGASARSSVPSEDAANLIRVVPKGLRCFDAGDAPFFLELLPGPRGRHGIPESVRHWKARVEELDADDSFAVGLFYGPSGCGKSSFVRAGLLPLLSACIESVYVEATPDETESQLLKRLQKKLPDLPVELGLAQCLAAVRRGFGMESGRKLLVVIDQFEQWLSGRCEQDRRSLVEALRQCDGARVQCLLLVRDDFWLAVSRFMSELEIELIQGRNTALVDLFDPHHARKVLLDFGRAYGRLPSHTENLTAPQCEFLERAVAGLTEEDKIIPVRLALFAEMVKGRDWNPETLRSIGGAAGVGVTFLEETFRARSANPRNRVHERAARSVLEALLPKPGSPIKGHVRSYPELLDRSGYGHRPREFKDLMRILDGETRLLTPADLIRDAPGGDPSLPPVRYYQLTHDYLVPALREWLTKKQQATPAGRAELRLVERSAMWNSTYERRQLPSLWEWLSIRLLTRPPSWTPPQRKMMRAASRQHALFSMVWCAAALLLLMAGAELTTSARTLFLRIRASTAPIWLAFGQEEAIFPLLQADPDPTLRTEWIHGLSPLLISSERLVARATDSLPSSIRRALLLGAGEMAPQVKSGSESSVDAHRPVSESLISPLNHLFQNDPDPGIHAAAEWVLRRIQRHEDAVRLDSVSKTSPSSPDRQWYVTGEGHTLIIVPGPAQFRVGASRNPFTGNDDSPHDIWIRRSYSISSKEVTSAQFLRFLAATRVRASTSAGRIRLPPDFPELSVTWYEAAAYCNWLSEKEGLEPDQWCFVPNAAGEYAQGMGLASDWMNLRGYRLPTEAEWEYACRAGAETAWYFGSDVSLLTKYGHGAFNSNRRPSPVGLLKPNDFGLFDMLGNAAEWCLDDYGEGPAATHSGASMNAEAMSPVSDRTPRVVRGGAYTDDPQDLRCGSRASMLPAMPAVTVGFRVARSYP